MELEVTAQNECRTLGDAIRHVQSRRGAVMITKNGQPIAAVVDYPCYERLQALRSRFDALSAQLGVTYEGVPEAVAQREIAEAIRAARSRRDGTGSRAS